MMIDRDSQLHRIGKEGILSIGGPVGKYSVRVLSRKTNQIHMTKKELYELADNIKDWCKDMVDPPVEKEECASGVGLFVAKLDEVQTRFIVVNNSISKLMDRVEKLEREFKRHKIWVSDIEKQTHIGVCNVMGRVEELELKDHSDDG